MTDEKKPVALGVRSPPAGPLPSGDGVGGATVMLESLLGPIAAPPDLVLLWMLAFGLRVGEPLSAGLLTEMTDARLSGEVAKALALVVSVGVGGVFTMEGALLSAEGGVRGGAVVVSILGVFDFGARSAEEATLARGGGSGMPPLLGRAMAALEKSWGTGFSCLLLLLLRLRNPWRIFGGEPR